MNSLFPEMEREIREDRKASRRERVQHARNYLRDRDISWLANHLLEKPADEHTLMIAAMEEGVNDPFAVIYDLWSLWLTRKLWRSPRGVHPGSGEESYLYGLRGVHEPPKLHAETNL